MESNSKQRLKQSIFEIADLFVEKQLETNDCHFCGKQVTQNDLENTKLAFRLDGNKVAHSGCMKCDICLKVQRDAKNLHCFDDQLLCGTCFNSLKCVSCTKQVKRDVRRIVQITKQNFQTWHTTCFNCSDCKKVISDDNYKIHKSVVKCSDCSPEAETIETEFHTNFMNLIKPTSSPESDGSSNFQEFRKTISEELITFSQLHEEFNTNPAVGQNLIRTFLMVSKSQIPPEILNQEEIQHLIYLDSVAFIPFFREIILEAQNRIHKTMKGAYLEFIKQLRLQQIPISTPPVEGSVEIPPLKELPSKSPRIRRDVPFRKGLANVVGEFQTRVETNTSPREREVGDKNLRSNSKDSKQRIVASESKPAITRSRTNNDSSSSSSTSSSARFPSLTRDESSQISKPTVQFRDRDEQPSSPKESNLATQSSSQKESTQSSQSSQSSQKESVTTNNITKHSLLFREDSSQKTSLTREDSSSTQNNKTESSKDKPVLLFREDSMNSAINHVNVTEDANTSLNPDDWICDYCEAPIGTDKEFEVAKGNTRIHSFCFLCVICGKSLQNVKPYVWVKEEKALMCGPCAKNVIKNRCSGCKKFIILKFITLESHHFHHKCVKCLECDESNIDNLYLKESGSLICLNCSQKDKKYVYL